MISAAKLDKIKPVHDYSYYEHKYKEEGYSGKDLYEKIINKSKETNSKVNSEFGKGSK